MTEAWHDECRRLRAQGLSQPEIAKKVNRSPYNVRLVLNETPEQELAFRRARERTRQRSAPRDRAVGKNGSRFQTYWKARAAAPGTITQEIKQAAILAYAHGDIDRHEMRRRITPRDKWSKEGLYRVE
jgi:hypothetical protein